MKLIIMLFIIGLVAGIVFSLLRLRKISAGNITDRFECKVCDDKDCECQKKDD